MTGNIIATLGYLVCAFVGFMLWKENVWDARDPKRADVEVALALLGLPIFLALCFPLLLIWGI